MTQAKRTSKSMLKQNDLIVFARKRRMDKQAHQKRLNRMEALKNERRKEQ